MIVKFSEGGMPALLDWTPISTRSAEVKTSADSSQKEGGGLTIDKFFPLIKELDALPNESIALTNDLMELFKYNIYGSNKSANPAQLEALYAKYLAYLSPIKHNAKLWGDTKTNLMNKEALNEIAITLDGQLIARNEDGELEQISIEDYQNNPQAYQLQTNQKLLYLRSHDPNYAFDNHVYDTLTNGTSLKEIGALIKSNLTNLGTTKIAQDGYSERESQHIIKGIEYIQQAVSQGADISGMSVEGLYKHKILTESQANQAQLALNYVYNMLPRNMKTLLVFNTGNEENAKQFIMQNILSTGNATVDWSMDLVEDPNKKAAADKAKAVEGQKLNTAAQFLMGKGYKSEYTISNGTSDGLHIKSTSLPIVTKDGALGNTTLQQVSKSEFAGIIDWQNVHMGNTQVDINAMSRVTSDGNMHLIDAPIDTTALKEGHIKPDFVSLKKKELADAYIRENGITDIATMNEVYADFELPYKYTSDGKLNTKAWASFCVTNGYADKKALKVNSEIEVDLKETTDELEIENAAKVFDAVNNTKEAGSWDFNNWGLIEWGHDTMYKGTIWMPLKANIFNAMAGSGEDLAVGTIQDWDTKQSVLDKQKQLRGTINLQSFPQ